MTTTNSDSLDTVKQLWNESITAQSYGTEEQYYEHILEQYKVYVESTSQISQQRSIANSFFLTLHTLLIGAIGLIFQAKFLPEPRWLILLPIVAALVLCWAWWRLLKSYRQLNSGKFDVIDAFEARLPTRPFVSAEWHALGEGKLPELYMPFTHVERVVPLIFGVLYVLSALGFIFSLVVPSKGG